MISIRRRLIISIVLLLSVLWLAATAWAVYDMRQGLQTALDARLASSARMVQTLIGRGDISLASPQPRASSLDQVLNGGLRGEAGLTCQLWSLDGELMSLSQGAPVMAAPQDIPDGYSNRIIDGEHWRLFALTDPTSALRVVTAEKRELRRALLAGIAVAVSTPFALALPAMLLLVWYGVGRGLRPLQSLRDSLQQRHADALEPVAPDGVPIEVAPLVDSLNRLFTRLRQAFERERRFTGDAAHELRTPLAGLKTQLQLARAAEGEQRERALAQAEAVTDRMGHLVQQLLELARLDAGRAPEGRSDAADVARAVIAECSDRAEAQEVALRWQANARSHVAIAPAMLHTALRNLIMNALAHAPAGSRIDICLSVTASHALIEVLDEGPGIPPEQLERVRERFYRSPAADREGSGLGLAIVAAIVERYGGELVLTNRSPGLRATLRLPLASPADSGF